MADIPIQVCNFAAAGFTPTLAAAAAGDTIPISSGERTVLEVTNGDGASINVTLAAAISSTTVPGIGSVSISNLVVAVPAGQSRRIGPIPQGYVTDGRASVSYSALTSVTRAAVRIPDLA